MLGLFLLYSDVRNGNGVVAEATAYRVDGYCILKVPLLPFFTMNVH